MKSNLRQTLNLISTERKRQLEKWGPQHHQDGTGAPVFKEQADYWRTRNDMAGNTESQISWKGILLEEVYEALAESDPTKLAVELIQVAAVAAAWVEDINGRD